MRMWRGGAHKRGRMNAHAKPVGCCVPGEETGVPFLLLLPRTDGEQCVWKKEGEGAREGGGRET